MKKPEPTHKLGMVMFTMLLLCLGACKRDPLLPPTPNVLNSYRGNDKIVLQVVEELKKPDNGVLLAEIEKQGGINWEYQALITSRFLNGVTLRFATGSGGNYLDAEVNAKTMAVKLYSKQQQEQRDALLQQAFAKGPKGNSTQTGVCSFNLSFELAPASLNIYEIVAGLTKITEFLAVQGFNGGIVSVSGLYGLHGYYVYFEAKNNETETQVKTLLNNTIAAYCQWRGMQDSSCWLILNLKIDNSCNAEGNNPGPTVWGVNREEALGSLNTALWNYQACSAAQYEAKARFDALYQNYIANTTSASADIFRTRLSLLLSDVPSIVASYCSNGGVDPGTPVYPGGGGGDTGETIEPVQINIPLKYCNFNFQEAFGVQWQAAGIRGIGIILAPNDGPLIFDIEVGLPMYSQALGRTISRLEAQRESANAYAIAMGIVNSLYSAGQISKTAIPSRVASEMQKELNRHFGFTVARVSKTLGVNPGAPTSRANFNLNCP